MSSLAASGGWITSEEARAHVHEMRHANDAIMVGVGTIIADDPLLTDRTGLPRRRPLLRVILDSRLRLPLDSRVVRDGDVRRHRVLLLRRRKQAAGTGRARNDGGAGPHASAAGRRNHSLPQRRPDHPTAGPTWNECMAKLGEREITSLIIEGGAMVNWAALSAGIVDKIFFYYAPKILAGTGFDSVGAGHGLSPHQRSGLCALADAAPLRRGLCGRRIFARSVRGRLIHVYVALDH